jgi:hypothetical protein
MLRHFRFLIPIALVFVAHYIAANLYATICAPLSLKGLLYSFFTTSSPVCNALLGVLSYTSNNYGLILSGILAVGVAALSNTVAGFQSCEARPTRRRVGADAGAGPTPA